MSLIVSDVSYIHPDREPLFRGVSFTLAAGEKAALVGDNGSGKSTLLRIIARDLPASGGGIAFGGELYCVPQHFGQYDRMTLAGAIGVAGALEALRGILRGDLSPENYTLLGDRWDLEERIASALAEWGLAGHAPDDPVAALSGGEKSRLFLAGLSLRSPDLILMDEPSNHLDLPSRRRLYRLIEETPAAVLVVSHDRTLLNRLGTTYELGPDGVTAYGGNYEFYKAAKEEQAVALDDRLGEQRKQLRAAQRTARQAAERKQRNDSRGDGKARREGAPRIMLNTLRSRAENSSSKLSGAHDAKIAGLERQIGDTRRRIDSGSTLKIALEAAQQPAGRTLVEASGVNVAYGERWLWPEPLDFRIAAGSRTAVTGRNGAGKTTLLKLVCGELEPAVGTIRRERFSWLYVDQEYAGIDPSETLYGYIERQNRLALPEHRLKTELHRFLFPRTAWDKKCATLSGGEKMKLLFCGMLVSDSAPDLFMLDEPTNNLDIRSLEIVAEALQGYRGTLLVISHDAYFLDRIAADSRIEL